jgi:ABC-2 type transport system ATP-binding protein
MSKPVIVLNELTKSYGKHRGIENISFTVEQGEVFGFIGPNGAGKSTTIRTLMGLLKPSNGGASIFGLDCSREPARIAKDVGYLPSENCYYNNKTRIKLRLDTELKNFPLFCPKCKQETLISVEKFKILVITEPDAQTQSR